jgi:transposase
MALVRDVFRQDPLSGHLFVFFSKRRDRVRLVYWDRNGFAMWTKRLEKGRFCPTFSADGTLAVSAMEAAELALIIEGSIWRAPGDDRDGSPASLRRRSRFPNFFPRKGDPFFHLTRLRRWMQRTPTSPYVPDLDQLRAWLGKMIVAMKFVELVVAIVGLIGRMRDINLELTKRVAHLTRKRPRAETLERLERQHLLPLSGLVAPVLKPATDEATQPKGGKRRHSGGGRGASPAHIPRLELKNPVPSDLRTCPLCGNEMKTVAHAICETLNVVPARFYIEHRVDETVACPNDDAIVSAPPPPAIVERGKLGDTLIVEATCDKYIEHQPVERQSVRFARAGVDIAPQTLGRSVCAHIVTKLIVQGWPNSRLRELLPDRMLAAHPELYVGDRSALPGSSATNALGP